MRYVRYNDEERLINGHSQVCVRTIGQFTRPASPGRVIKVFAVVGALHNTPNNQVKPGMLLTLSFPETEANSRDYTWRQKDPNEETQVPVNVQLHKRKGIILSDKPTTMPDFPTDFSPDPN